MKYTFSLIIAALFAVLTMSAQEAPTAYFTASDFTISAGDTVEMGLGIENASVTIKGFQVTVTLPEGLSFAKYREWNDDDEEWVEYYGKLSSRKKSDHLLASADAPLEGNKLTFLSYSPTAKTFKNSTGTIMTFLVVAADNIASGNYTVGLSNMVISDLDDNPIANDDFSVTATVDGVSTGVEAIESVFSGKVYDILGRPVANPVRGLYIQDGKVIYK